MILYMKRKIAAAHYLPDHKGACRHLHGHTFLVETWLKGEVDSDTGMVVDFGHVKKVIDELDHQLLNDVLPNEYLPPTAENLVRYFLRYISSAYKVRVWESDDCSAEDRKPYEEIDSYDAARV